MIKLLICGRSKSRVRRLARPSLPCGFLKTRRPTEWTNWNKVNWKLKKQKYFFHLIIAFLLFWTHFNVKNTRRGTTEIGVNVNRDISRPSRCANYLQLKRSNVKVTGRQNYPSKNGGGKSCASRLRCIWRLRRTLQRANYRSEDYQA